MKGNVGKKWTGILGALCAGTFAAALALAQLPHGAVGKADAETERAPLLLYDFSAETLPDGYDAAAASSEGIAVENLGTLQGASGTLIPGNAAGQPDATVKDGKLSFDQKGALPANGSFSLPDGALTGLETWTLSMKVSDFTFDDNWNYNFFVDHAAVSAGDVTGGRQYRDSAAHDKSERRAVQDGAGADGTRLGDGFIDECGLLFRGWNLGARVRRGRTFRLDQRHEDPRARRPCGIFFG